MHLLVGVLPDSSLSPASSSSPSNIPPSSLPHAERCELLRHCRWVDEVIVDAPRSLTDHFLRLWNVDYVAIEEGSSVDPECDRERLRGYDRMKELGRVIPTRRTTGVVGALPKDTSQRREGRHRRVESASEVPPPSPSPSPSPPGTPRSPLPLFEEGPPLDIYGIGI